MKKLLTILGLATVGYALPVGNPIDASLYCNGVWGGKFCDMVAIRMGFYGDYVFDDYLREFRGGSNNGGMLHKSTLNTNAALVDFNFCDRLDIFWTVGTTNISLVKNVLPVPEAYAEFQYSTTFSWSVGGRITLWECGGFGFGCEGQYFRTAPKVNYVTTYSSGNATYFGDHESLYQSWQGAIGVTYRMVDCANLSFIHYAAFKYSGANFKNE
ncbi:MAG: hypothetical protein ACKVOH_01655, partial [Chlamydiales bacterium]